MGPERQAPQAKGTAGRCLGRERLACGKAARSHSEDYAGCGGDQKESRFCSEGDIAQVSLGVIKTQPLWGCAETRHPRARLGAGAAQESSGGSPGLGSRGERWRWEEWLSLGVLNRRKTHSKVRRSWGYSSQHSRREVLCSAPRGRLARYLPLEASSAPPAAAPSLPGGTHSPALQHPRLLVAVFELHTRGVTPCIPCAASSDAVGDACHAAVLTLPHVRSREHSMVYLPSSHGATLVVVPGLGWLHPAAVELLVGTLAPGSAPPDGGTHQHRV